MKRPLPRVLLLLLAVLLVAAPARGHIGSKDIFQQVNVGPYRLFVTIRPPTVIPGLATLEVRSTGASITALHITSMPLTGEASRHPPVPDAMQRSAIDPAFFTGETWLMASGPWQTRLQIDGPDGPAAAAVPVPAVPLAMLRMSRSLSLTLVLLGLFLCVTLIGIISSAARESTLDPQSSPLPRDSRNARIAAVLTALVLFAAVLFGRRWWNIDDRNYSADIYHPLHLQPTLNGNTLDLVIGMGNDDNDLVHVPMIQNDLLPDHGHLMHLYAIRQPQMDAVFHLHPALVGGWRLRMTLPSMPPGTYRLYADIVHANGFPDTLTTLLTIPVGLQPSPLAPDDAAALPPPLSAGELSTSYTLPDGYTMTWDRPQPLTASTAYSLRFHLLDPQGQPATDRQPYLGMAGHAAFVKTDGTTFAHTHPEGSTSMPALLLANPEDPMVNMTDMPVTIPSTTDFPYGFPTPGRYRIFIQMKHAGTVETGVFDANVQ